MRGGLDDRAALSEDSATTPRRAAHLGGSSGERQQEGAQHFVVGLCYQAAPIKRQQGCPTFGPDEKIHSCNQKQLGETVLFKA